MMNRHNKVLAFLLALICIVSLISGCSGPAPAKPTEPAPAVDAAKVDAPAVADAPAAVTDAPAVADAPAAKVDAPKEAVQKTKLVFYGNRTGEPSWEKMVNATIALHPELDVQVIDIDWANIDKIIKTGIAAGNPPDLTHCWPMQLRPYVNAGQSLDLTPYLEENDGAWKKTFPAELLDIGKYDGKYYGVPYQSTFPTFYVNVTMFKACGVEVPTGEWTWQQFMDTCATIKAKQNIAPFALARDVNSWMARLGTSGYAAADGKLAEFAAGKMDFTQNYVPQTMKNIKDLYDNKYWYPGEGALNVTRDEAKTAFVQGKAAIIAEVNLIYPELINQVDFEIAPVLWPAMAEKTLVVGGTDGFMIPANAANKDGAVAFMKTFLSPEIQQQRADASYPVAVNGVSVSDPIVLQLMEQTKFLVNSDFINVSAKVQDYVVNQLTANYILNKGDGAIADLEKLRKQAE